MGLKLYNRHQEDQREKPGSNRDLDRDLGNQHFREDGVASSDFRDQIHNSNNHEDDDDDDDDGDDDYDYDDRYDDVDDDIYGDEATINSKNNNYDNNINKNKKKKKNNARKNNNNNNYINKYIANKKTSHDILNTTNLCVTSRKCSSRTYNNNNNIGVRYNDHVLHVCVVVCFVWLTF